MPVKTSLVNNWTRPLLRDIKPGECFANEDGDILLKTDEADPREDLLICVDVESGVISRFPPTALVAPLVYVGDDLEFRYMTQEEFNG